MQPNVRNKEPTVANKGTLVVKVLAFIVHILGGPLYFALGLLVPMPVVIVMLAIWAGLLAMMIIRRNDWRYVIAGPLIAIALWFAVPTAGEAMFGWTA